jgi:hypothetical protein
MLIQDSVFAFARIRARLQPSRKRRKTRAASVAVSRRLTPPTSASLKTQVPIRKCRVPHRHLCQISDLEKSEARRSKLVALHRNS